MPDDGLGPVPVPRAVFRKPPAVPSGVIGMVLFLAAEMMFFAGLISAYAIARASVPPILWPPPGQPRLPVEATAFNSVVLLASGVLLFLGSRLFRSGDAQKRARAVRFVVPAVATGAFFVLFQGFEWVRLIAQGLTLTSSNHGSFFYTIVGTHALHAIAGLWSLVWITKRLRQGALKSSEMLTAQIFWSFVVLLWPILYVLVYL